MVSKFVKPGCSGDSDFTSRRRSSQVYNLITETRQKLQPNLVILSRKPIISPQCRPKNSRPAVNAAFSATRWTIIYAARKDSPEALEKLYKRYWHPLYAFIRRDWPSKEQAEDLVQGFSCELLSRDFLKNVTPEKASFAPSFSPATRITPPTFANTIQRKKEAAESLYSPWNWKVSREPMRSSRWTISRPRSFICAVGP